MIRALTFASVMLTAVTAAAQPPPPPAPMPTVVVRGQGEVRAVPDVAFVTIGAEARAQTPKDAQATAAKAMTAVQQRLAAAGVPRDAVRTLTYDLQAQFDFSSGKQVPRGFLARNVIEVRVDDLQKVGDTIDLAVSAGGTSVEGVRFDLKQRDALEREALTKAVADERARAEAAAKGAGASVVAVLRIEESGVEARPMQSAMFRMAADGAAAAPPPIVPGETSIRASVTLTAAIK
ncbi:MAG: SIMPL domain-containing protein [Acidobacteriota bacterium]